MPKTTASKTEAQVHNLVEQALKLGADGADAVMFDSADVSVSYRLGHQEHIERAENRGIGLRVMIGKRQALVSSSDTSENALLELASRAIAMAKVAPEDPFIQLAELTHTGDLPDLQIYDAHEPSVECLAEQARATEDAARSVAGITNSEGASASHGSYTIALATSKGFTGSYRNSHHSLSVSVLAGEGTQMERDHDYSVARFLNDLRSPEQLGKNAAAKALRRLNPKPIRSAKLPVIYEPDVARELLGTFASAVNGVSVARGTSFLKGKMDEKLFPDNITLVDDPLRVKGLASKPFDAEGIRGQKRLMVEDGVLRSWFLDLRSSAQLGLKTTGHATRSLGSPPSPSCTNFYMENGANTPDTLMADIKDGLYITDLFGMGINTVTGDYSQGAAGFRIENGKLTHAVNEITLAGHLLDMFAHLTPANDLSFRYGINSPTLRIEGMTIAAKQ